MRHFPVAVALAAVLTSCSIPRIRYEPASGTSAIKFNESEMPKLLVEPVIDDTVTPEDLKVLHVEWSTIVHEAITTELERLGWPMTIDPGVAGARLKVIVTKADASWPKGKNVPVQGLLRLALLLQEPTGRAVWKGELSGNGHSIASRGGVAAPAVARAWKESLNNAIVGLGPLLDSQHPWTKLGRLDSDPFAAPAPEPAPESVPAPAPTPAPAPEPAQPPAPQEATQ